MAAQTRAEEDDPNSHANVNGEDNEASILNKVLQATRKC